MNKAEYQIIEKAKYLQLLILTDELQSYHDLLLQEVTDINDWSRKLRNVRNVFLSLNNVKDAMDRINLNTSKDYISLSRNLKKKLLFANHFRNRAVGHLNEALLERSVQWSPQLFYSELKENEQFKVSEAHRVIIEACINSFVDQNGKQKLFNGEIDLMYPPDAKLFFDYLYELVTESIEWLQSTSEFILSNIKHHNESEMKEMSIIAGQTNFNLKEDSSYKIPSLIEQKEHLNKIIIGLKKIGADEEVIEFIQEQFKTYETLA